MDNSLKLEKRNETGGSSARRLLERGMIPAVVYGKDMASTAACVNKKDLRKFLKTHGKNSVFKTEFAQEHDIQMLIKDIQYDPINKNILHIDFQKLSPEDKVRIKIPVKIKDIESINKAGKAIIRQLDSVLVECLPQNIPAYAEADVSQLEAGQSLTAGDINLPSGVLMITKPDKIILTVKGDKHTEAQD